MFASFPAFPLNITRLILGVLCLAVVKIILIKINRDNC
jgi:hypothetical protein